MKQRDGRNESKGSQDKRDIAHPGSKEKVAHAVHKRSITQTCIHIVYSTYLQEVMCSAKSRVGCAKDHNVPLFELGCHYNSRWTKVATEEKDREDGYGEKLLIRRGAVRGFAVESTTMICMCGVPNGVCVAYVIIIIFIKRPHLHWSQS